MTTSTPTTRKPLSPWSRWLLLFVLPIGLGLPTAAMIVGVAVGAR